MKVRIKKIPQARTGYQVRGALVNDVPAFGGADYNAYIGEKASQVRKTISGVPRHMANLEAEGGETVVGNIDGSSMPSSFVIKGPRHSSGGVPLNLPDDSFIFSDTKSMTITDPKILKMFGVSPKKGGFTPAELSKKYDINKYRKILQDPNSDKMDRKTAEMMIKNYVMKLGALALAQESMKAFPQGIPEISKPYMEANGISEEALIPQQAQPQSQEMMQMSPEMMNQSAPTQMPNGEPIAQPQSMEEDMMAQEQPMAFGGIFKGKKNKRNTIINNNYYGYNPNEEMEYTGSYDNNVSSSVSPEYNNSDFVKNITPTSNTEGFARFSDGTFSSEGYTPPAGYMQGGVPMAMYGMSMGGYDFPYYPQEMEYGGSLPKAKTAGQTPIVNSTTTPTIIVQSDVTPEEQKIIDTKWNGKKDLYLKYKQTEKAIKNNPDFQKKLFAQYNNVIENENYYTGKKKSNWYDALKNRKESEVLDALLNQEERNLRLKAYGLDAKTSGQKKAKDKNTNLNQKAYDLIKKYPESLGDLNFSKGYLGQAAYIAYDDLINESKPKGYGSEKVGKEDELKGRPNLSGIDNAIRDTSLGQFIETTPEIIQTQPTAVVDKKCPCMDSTGKLIPNKFAKEDANGNCLPETCAEPITDKDEVVETPITPQQVREPEWWLQDTINTLGAFGDRMTLKKYMPWAPKVDLETPQPTFLDPTRELAANAEQANIQTQGMGQFAGPQALSARSSSVQGQAAKNAADILSRYNNANVNLANQFEMQNANINNQEQMTNQGITQKLYDQNTIANQQYDNAKRQAMANMRQAYTNALTNKWKTDALNQMYPNYQVSPGSGGRVAYVPTDKELTPGALEKTYGEKLKELVAQGWDKDQAQKFIIEQYKSSTRMQQGGTPGYIYTDWPIFL